MPEQFRVVIPPRVYEELREVFLFIQQSSPQNAVQMIREIRDAIKSLETLPHRFAKPRTGKVPRASIRSMPVKPYLVRYRIDNANKTVYVIRVRHGHRRRP